MLLLRFSSENRVLIVCAIVSLSLLSCIGTADPEDTIRNLYGWYVRELKNNVNPLTERRTELKQFLSKRMLTSIDNLRLSSNGFDGNALLDLSSSIRVGIPKSGSNRSKHAAGRQPPASR